MMKLREKRRLYTGGNYSGEVCLLVKTYRLVTRVILTKGASSPGGVGPSEHMAKGVYTQRLHIIENH